MWNPATRFTDSVIAGATGAIALTAVHQAARAVTDDAPRMDVVGMRALARGLRAAGAEPRGHEDAIYGATLAGDLLSNSAYYALATTWPRGVALGLAAGIGALLLPEPMGLGTPPKSERLPNQLMTVAWYLIGGVVGAATARRLAGRRGGSGRFAAA